MDDKTKKDIFRLNVTVAYHANFSQNIITINIYIYTYRCLFICLCMCVYIYILNLFPPSLSIPRNYCEPRKRLTSHLESCACLLLKEAQKNNVTFNNSHQFILFIYIHALIHTLGGNKKRHILNIQYLNEKK